MVPRVLRRLGAEGEVEWFAAIADDDQPCVLITSRVRSVIAKALAAHQRGSAHDADQILAPLAHDLDAPTPWLALVCDPIGTFDDLRTRWARRSLPYSEGIVVTRSLARTFAAAHAAGVCLGGLAPSQLLIDRDATFKVLGFGFDETAWSTRTFMAPMVAMGSAPTPAADIQTGLMFMRAHIHWVQEVPGALARLLQGTPGPLERGLGRALFSTLTTATTIDGATGLRGLERFWALVGVTPDDHAMAARLRATFADARVRIELATDFSWVSVDGGERHDLTRSDPARRVLRELVMADGAPRSIDELVAAAWPGEALVGSSGADRLYVALSTLRKWDLRPAIVRERGHYLLRAIVRFVGEAWLAKSSA